MILTLGDIATMLDLELEGDPSVEITGVCGIEEAQPGEISFVANPKYALLLKSTKASAVIVGHGVAVAGVAALRSDDPYLSFGRLLAFYASNRAHHTGHHPNAVVAPSATVHDTAALHAGVVVEPDAVVDEGSILYPGVYVGAGSRIGAGSLLYSNVVIRENVHVGARAILHSGVVLGARATQGDVQPGAGGGAAVGVVVEDDVELGAHTTVDRGYAHPTTIGAGTKVDNLVHIGSEATIGPACLIVAQVGIAAGAVIGASVTLAGQATILPNVCVGDHAIVTAKAGVDEDVPGGELYSGAPARPHGEQRQVYAALRRLPRRRQQMLELERRLRALEQAQSHE